MNGSAGIRKVWALIISLACALNTVPYASYAEEETAPEEETVLVEENASEEVAPENEEEPVFAEEEPAETEIPSENPKADFEIEGDLQTDITPIRPEADVRPMSDLPQDPIQIDGTNVYWRLENRTLEITGTGAMPDYSLRNNAPWYGELIEEVIIADGITRIGDYSFKGKLEDDTYCISSITIPDSVTSIGKRAITQTNITELVIPENVETIGENAFTENLSCKTVTINSNYITDIPKEAFSHLAALESINIPSSVKTMGAGAFYGAGFYRSEHGWPMYVDITDVAAWCDIDFDYSLYEIGQIEYTNPLHLDIAKLRVNGEVIEDLVIPEGVQTIKSYAFDGGTQIRSVHLPSTLKTIGKKALSMNRLLGRVYITDLKSYAEIESEEPITTYGPNYLYLNDELIRDLQIPDLTYTIGKNAFSGYQNLTSITLSAHTTWIKGNAFSNCGNVTEITLNDRNLTIDEDAFAGDTHVTRVNIGSLTNWCYSSVRPSGSPVLSNNADIYSNNILIKDLVIPEDVNYIGSTFRGWNIESVTFPKAISIPEDGFKGTSHLTDVYYPDLSVFLGMGYANEYANPLCGSAQLHINNGNLPDTIDLSDRTYINKYVFLNTGITEVIFSDDLQHIDEGAFENCIGLTSVSIPANLRKIDKCAFKGCSGLTSVTFGPKSYIIEADAFADCTSLEAMYITDLEKWYSSFIYTAASNPQYNGASLYLNGEKVTNLIIPENAEEIRNYAFVNNKDITSVSLPATLTTVRTGAFSGCTNLASVDYAGTAGARQYISIESDNNPLINAEWTYGEADLASGTCGENLQWRISSDGILMISGTGAMTDYTTSSSEAPWYQYRQSITGIILPDSLTAIGVNAFYGLENVTSITIPASVTQIGIYALSFTGITDIYYGGYESVWNEMAVADQLSSKTLHCLVADGTCGESLTWSLNNEGLLSIEGSGDMTGYTFAEDVPWNEYADRISTLYIGKDVTRVYNTALDMLQSLNDITCEPWGKYIVEKSPEEYGSHGSTVLLNQPARRIDYALYGSQYKGQKGVDYVCLPAYFDEIARGVFPADSDLDLVIRSRQYDVYDNPVVNPDNGRFLKAPKLYSYGQVGDVAASGNAGNSVSWQLIKNGENEDGSIFTLSFNGSGAIRSYSSDTYSTFEAYLYETDGDIRQWDLFRKFENMYFDNVVIGEGIIGIGENAFMNMETGSVSLPSTLEEAASGNFEMMFVGGNGFTVAEGNTAFSTDETHSLFIYDKSELIKYNNDYERVSYVIPESVEIIDRYAFVFANLTSVTIPDSVYEIGEGAFEGSSLQSAVLPAGLTVLEPYVFSSCYDLSELTLPRNLMEMDTSAIMYSFGDNVKLWYPGTYSEREEIVFTESDPNAQTIRTEDLMFSRCGDNLSFDFNDDNGVLTISGSGRMWNFIGIDSGAYDTTSVVSPMRTEIGTLAANTIVSLRNALGDTDFGARAPWADYYVTSVVIEEGVSSIGETAFACLSQLESVTIPSTVSSIGTDAFTNAYQLHSITIDEENQSFKAEDNIIFSEDGLTLVLYPGGLGDESNPGTYTIPENVMMIDSSAFVYPLLEKVVIPETVTTIMDKAFIGTDIEYQGSFVDLMKACSYNSNDDLHSLINRTVFTKCGDNLTWRIDYETNALVIEGSGPMWDFEDSASYSGEFDYLDYNWNEMPENAFGNMAPWSLSNNGYIDVSNVILPQTLTRLGDYAFINCDVNGISQLSIPAALTEIGTGALSCHDNYSYTVDAGNPAYTAVDGVLFTKDRETLVRYPQLRPGTDVNSVVYEVPPSVKEIAPLAFLCNSEITELRLPRSIEKIGDRALDYVEYLQTIKYPGTRAEWNDVDVDPAANEELSKIVFGNEPVGELTGQFEDGVLTISGLGIMPDYETGDTPWEAYRNTAHTVVIGSGIANISANAFAGFTNLKTLYLPRFLTEVSDSAFTGVSLEHVYSAGKTTEFDEYGLNTVFSGIEVSFTNCGDDLTWSLDNGTLIISGTGPMWEDPFPWILGGYSETISSVQIGEQVTHLADKAFYDMPNLSEFTVPVNVSSISGNPWGRNFGLKEFKVADGNTAFTVQDGVLFSADMKELISYPAGKKGASYAVPEGVTTIKQNAFDGILDSREFASCLNVITLPVSLKTVEVNAFRFTTDQMSLNTIYYPGTYSQWEYFRSDNLREGNYDALNGAAVYYTKCGDNLTWSVRDGVLTIKGTGQMWDMCASGGEHTESVVSPMGGVSIMSNTMPKPVDGYFGTNYEPWFNYADNIYQIIVEDGITDIGNKAFNHLGQVWSVSLPSTLQEIDYQAFESCGNLAEVIYPGSEHDRSRKIDIKGQNLPIAEYALWYYGAYNVIAPSSPAATFDVTVTRDGAPYTFSDYYFAYNGETLNVTVTAGQGYRLKEGKQTEFTITVENADVILDASDYVEKESAIQDLDDIISDNEKSVGDIIKAFDSGSAEEMNELINIIDNARASGQEVTVELQIKENVENPEDSLLVIGFTPEGSQIDYFDIDLSVMINNDPAGNISEIYEPVTVTLPLSQDIKDRITAGGTVQVIRVHGDKAALLECTVSEDGNYISFMTDKFSTYAVFVAPEPVVHTHTTDNENDLICNVCGERAGYKVTLTSMLEGDPGTTSIANLQGGGIYHVLPDFTTEQATVTAQDKVGFDFLGWYEGIPDSYSSEPVSTKYIYTFTPKKDIKLVAVYRPTTSTLQVKVTGSRFMITGSSTPQRNITKRYRPGTLITLEYVDDSEDFQYWVNSSAKIISRSETYTFPLVSATTLEAISVPKNYTESNMAYVEFISAFGQIMAAETYSAESTIDFPAGPSKFGFEFTGWDLTEDDIHQKIRNGDTHIVVSPTYKKNEKDKKLITVTYLNDLHEQQYYEAYLSDSVILTAAEIPGYKFSCWKSSDGYTLSTSEQYKIKTAGSADMFAEYVLEDEDVVQMPIIAMTGITAEVNGAKNNVVFIATRSVPEEYTIVKQGIIYSNILNFPSDDLENRLVLGGNGTKAYEDEGIQRNDHCTYHLNMGNYKDTIVYGRGFMIIENDAGEQIPVYSKNILSGTFNELIRKDGESE